MESTAKAETSIKISESRPLVPLRLIKAGFTDASASVLAEFTKGINTGVNPAAGI
jgi:hypothetical protein